MSCWARGRGRGRFVQWTNEFLRRKNEKQRKFFLQFPSKSWRILKLFEVFKLLVVLKVLKIDSLVSSNTISWKSSSIYLKKKVDKATAQLLSCQQSHQVKPKLASSMSKRNRDDNQRELMTQRKLKINEILPLKAVS